MRKQPNGYGAVDVLRFSNDQHAYLALVQLCWNEVNRRLPSQWHVVGLWIGPRNVVFGDKVVAFIAITPDEIAPLRDALAAFPLPADVKLLNDMSTIVRDFNNADSKSDAAEKICRSVN